MKRALILLLIVLALFSSCNLKRYPGYKWFGHGIFYRLVRIGEDTLKPKTGDYITVKLRYRSLENRIIFDGIRKFPLGSPSYKGGIEECFAYLSKGDAASFIIDAEKFYTQTLGTNTPSFLENKKKMIIDIEMIDIQTEIQYKREKEAFMRWIKDFGEYERVILKQYLEEQKLDVKPTASGLIFIKVKEGKARKVSLGDTLVIHYEGHFLNGKFFDSTKRRNEAFQFVYGQQWQVIKGLEEGVGMMHDGEKAILIVPSELAFGENGSTTGIIPPYTSLIYEVEVISLK